MTKFEKALLELDGAIIRYLAAKHLSLVESYDEEKPGFDDLVLGAINELCKAGIDAVEALEDYDDG